MYSTVRLRLPDDTLLKSCIGFVTDHLHGFTVKATSVTLWALARMSYPSKHLETRMMQKVQGQVQACLKEDQRFYKGSLVGER